MVQRSKSRICDTESQKQTLRRNIRTKFADGSGKSESPPAQSAPQAQPSKPFGKIRKQQPPPFASDDQQKQKSPNPSLYNPSSSRPKGTK
mmetsp:Transcript_42315/g.71547  ORF Transcript_42315/g.71547 Transcript_42315/m.71547 type:complete len:90 (+) Transcript_42315:77-346(+)